MKIGELATAAGVTRDAVRLYERKGLLVHISRPFEGNTYKDYGDENVRRIHILKSLQRFSFSLREIQEIFLERDATPEVCPDPGPILAGKLRAIDQEIEELTEIRNSIVEAIGNWTVPSAALN